MAGTSWSVKSSSSKVTLPLSNAMKIHVSKTKTIKRPILFFQIIIAGLTVGDPILRTGNPLSVELGPGKFKHH